MSNDIKVAVLGLGTMGHPFAVNLLKAGFEIWVWNRTPGKDEDLVAAGAHRANSAAEAAGHADVVISMLSTPDVTEAVLFGPEGALSRMKEGGVLAQMGTIGITATQQLAERCAKEFPQTVWIDAPVSGSKKPAENAQILVLASGDQERAKAVEPVFAAIGKGTRWLGPVGAGSRMKLVVNAWLIILMQGTIESALLAEKLGFSTDDLWSVLDGGPLAAPYMKPKLAKISAKDYATEMALEWGLKDALLAIESGDKTELPGLEKTADTWKKAVEAGFGHEDISSVAEFLRKL